jgi:hypothetical protein
MRRTVTQMAACARRWKPSLASTTVTVFFTVLSAIPSRRPISALGQPETDEGEDLVLAGRELPRASGGSGCHDEKDIRRLVEVLHEVK